MRSANWKMQAYTRNHVDSEAEHSETVTLKREIDDFKKWRAFYMMLLYATRTLLIAQFATLGNQFEDSPIASESLKSSTPK